MSSITNVSSYARYLGLVRTLTAGQNTVDNLSQQLTSGVKSTDLSAYGPDTQRLLDLRAEMAKRTSYKQNIDITAPRVKAYDAVLTSLEKMTADWQTSNMMPTQPGTVSISDPVNANPNGMKVTVNQKTSQFMLDATYNVTAVPSKTGGNGSYDITVKDSLGGTSTRTINLSTVPPDDGKDYTFKMSGGPGGGATLNLTFDTLSAASSSSFQVTWPDADTLSQRVNTAMTSIQGYLNERYGDRYLFAGSRYSTEPVGDLMGNQQTTNVTLGGAIVATNDYYEVTIDGKPFGYQVQASDPKSLTFVAQTLNSMIQKADPALPITASTNAGVITLTANSPGQTFDVSARAFNSDTVDNGVLAPTTTQAATLPAPAGTGLTQKDAFTLTGDKVDVGDTFQFTVGVGDPNDPYNQAYYQAHPNEPKDLPAYQAYTVSYTVSERDFNNGVIDVSHVADQLRQQFANINPAPPVAVDATGNGATINLTGSTTVDPNHPSRVQQFVTSAKVVNGNVENTATVATLPPGATAVLDLPTVNPPDLPYYDSQAMTTKSDPKAYDKATVTIDDGQSLSYGISSNDPAFQSLIKAFRMIQVAATNPGKYNEYIDKARDLMTVANDQIKSVHAKLSSDSSTLDQKKTEHSSAIASVTDQIASIEGIDQTEVATRLKSNMNALEAAYTVAGQTQKLSLLNYLT